MKILICVLFLSVPLWCQGASLSDSVPGNDVVVARCNTTCECLVLAKRYSAPEFNAICRGDKTKSVVLDDSLFASEAVPTAPTRTIYVRIHNFRSARVESDFVSRWLSYVSCSLDIWNAGNVTFPKETPSLAKTRVFYFVFAAIGVAGSSIDRFPNDLFKNKQSSGLKLLSSKINYLNLFSLSQKHLQYLTVKNSEIKRFEGNRSNLVSLEPSSYISAPPKVEIISSRIGYMSAGALAFNNHQPLDKKSSINIKRSTIGIVESSFIKLGTGIDFAMKDSTIGYTSSFAFKLTNKRKASFSVTNNILGVEKHSLGKLKCGKLLEIHNNYISPNILENCFSPENEDTETCSSIPCNDVSCYIDESCEQNYILDINAYNIKTTEPPTPTTTITTPTPTTTPSTTRAPTTTTIAPTIMPSTTITSTTEDTTVTESPTTMASTTTAFTTPETTAPFTTPTTTFKSSTSTEETSTTSTPQSTPLETTTVIQITSTLPNTETDLTTPQAYICNSTDLKNASITGHTISIHWLYLAAFCCGNSALVASVLLGMLIRSKGSRYAYAAQKYNTSVSYTKPSSTLDFTELDNNCEEEDDKNNETVLFLNEKNECTSL